MATLISCPAWLGQPSASMRKGRRIMTWRRQQQQKNRKMRDSQIRSIDKDTALRCTVVVDTLLQRVQQLAQPVLHWGGLTCCMSSEHHYHIPNRIQGH